MRNRGRQGSSEVETRRSDGEIRVATEGKSVSVIVMTNLMAAFFLFMSSSSCLAMAFLWADDDEEDEDEEEVPFSGKDDFRRFFAGGGAPAVRNDNQCSMMMLGQVRTRIQCQPGRWK